ncbi:hypothetical protein LCGC14_2354310 [marine sediment metagenome]
MKKIKFGYYGNFSTTHQTEVYIADALERAGHTVYRLDRNNTNLIPCDYVLFAKMSDMVLINKAKKQGIPTISWTFDLWREFLGYNHPHLKADIVITTDSEDKFHTIKQAVHKPEKIMIEGKKIYDVIFVGTSGKLKGIYKKYYKSRRELIKRVKPKVFSNVRGLALNKLLGQTKIVLGDSYPGSCCWSNRVYEMTGRGGFLIHPYIKNLYNYIPQFFRGEEKEMIEYYLEHEKKREKLRKIQFEMCPTYDDRIKELIELLRTINSNN